MKIPVRCTNVSCYESLSKKRSLYSADFMFVHAPARSISECADLLIEGQLTADVKLGNLPEGQFVPGREYVLSLDPVVSP